MYTIIFSLDLQVEGNVKTDGSIHQTSNYARYKRSYLPLKTGEAHAQLNVPTKTIEMEVGDIFLLL